jgi:hypothetical protein
MAVQNSQNKGGIILDSVVNHIRKLSERRRSDVACEHSVHERIAGNRFESRLKLA